MGAVTVFDRLEDLADPTRGRLLLLLEQHELAVTELCAVLQLPQSTVSRHLKTLSDGGWLSSRAEGTSRQYTVAAELDDEARTLWDAVRDRVAGGRTAAHDAERLRGVLAERRRRSQEFFKGAAAEWDTLRAELFGRRVELAALPALLDDRWTVGDLGCGTGSLSAALAPYVRRVVAVDGSKAMLAAARRRLAGADNVDLRLGDLEALPLDREELDAAVLLLVLHHVVEPSAVLAQAARAVKAGGRVAVIDMVPHDRAEYRQQMGHLWQGFGPEQLESWLEEAGIGAFRYVALPVDAAAKGPALFVATGRKL
jgi:ArsR family transcriptional regulator